MARSQAVEFEEQAREVVFMLACIAAAGTPRAGSVSAPGGLSWGTPHTPMHRGDSVKTGQWTRHWETAIYFRVSVSKARRCWLIEVDCDSCCRGFEPHQPPQVIQGSNAIETVAVGIFFPQIGIQAFKGYLD